MADLRNSRGEVRWRYSQKNGQNVIDKKKKICIKEKMLHRGRSLVRGEIKRTISGGKGRDKNLPRNVRKYLD